MITKFKRRIKINQAKKKYRQLKWSSKHYYTYDILPFDPAESFQEVILEAKQEITIQKQLLKKENIERHKNKTLYPEIYHPNFNRKFKTKIKERDNSTCQICKDTENLVIHHINYDKNNNCSNPKDFLTTCNSCNLSLNSNRPQQTKRCEQIIKKIYS